jgi:hypothetical protein
MRRTLLVSSEKVDQAGVLWDTRDTHTRMYKHVARGSADRPNYSLKVSSNRIDPLCAIPILCTGNERKSGGGLRFDPLDGADADVV